MLQVSAIDSVSAFDLADPYATHLPSGACPVPITMAHRKERLKQKIKRISMHGELVETVLYLENPQNAKGNRIEQSFGRII